LNTTESNDDSAEIDKLLTELENETLSEDSSKSEEIKDKQAADTLNKIKYEKPDWWEKKDDESNNYDYQEKEVEDKDW